MALEDDVEIRVRVNDDTEGGWRDVNGRLRDARGRFIAEGDAAGRGFDAGIRRGLKRVGDALGTLGKAFSATFKPLAALGAAGGLIGTLGGIAGALAQLAPAALLLPGALLAAGAAFAAIKIGMSGFSDALADGAAGAEAMAKLSPAAREAAKAVKGLAPAWAEVKNAVQDNLFKGIGDDVKALSKTYFPMLKSGLSDISAGFNGMGRNLTKALLAPPAVNDINEILTNTSATIKNMPNLLGNVTSGFLGLGAVGATYLPRLGTALEGVTGKFKTWVDQGVESGRINELIDGAIAGFKDLGAIVGNVGSIIGSIFSGLGGQMSSPLEALRNLTGALAEFFASAEAQGPLQALGETFSVVGEVLRDVLLAGLGALAPIVESLAPLVQTLATVVGDILTTAFDELGPPMQRLIDRIVPYLQPALGAIGTIITEVVIPALSTFIDWLAGPGIDAIVQFAQAYMLNFLNITIGILNFVSGFLGAMSKVFRVLSFLPGEAGAAFGRAADSADGAKVAVDGFRGTMEQVKSKLVELTLRSDAANEARRIKDALLAIPRVVGVSVNVYETRVSRGGGGFQRAATGGPRSGMTLVGEEGPELVRGMASGGVGSGLKLVGERGAELVRLPGGSSVIPTGQTQRMMSGTGGGGSGGATTVLLAAAPGADGMFATMIMQMVRTGVLQLRTA